MQRKIAMVWVILFVLGLSFLTSAQTFKYDLGGRTVRFNTRWRDVTPLGPRGEFNWYEPDGRLQAHIEAVEDMFNCQIEFTEPIIEEREAVMRFTEAFLSGDVYFDFTVISRQYLPALVANGFLLPLDDIIEPDYYDLHPRGFRMPSNLSDFMGRTYAVQFHNWPQEPGVIFWNKNIFEEYALPSLYDLYEADEWTYDAMEKLAIELTKDTDGDGLIDLLGLVYNGRFLGWGTWVATNNGNLAEYRDGKWVATIDEPETIQALEYLVRLTEELRVASSDQHAFGRGEAGMLMLWAEHLQQSWIQGLENVGIVPVPRGPLAERHVSPSGNAWLGVMPITVENPREVLEVAKALYQLSEPYMPTDLETWEENYWNEWSRFMWDRETLEHVQWAFENVRWTDFTLEFRNFGWEQARQDMAAGQGKSVAVVLAEIKPAFQAYLDDLFNQH